MTIEQARRSARKRLNQVSEGSNPNEMEKARRAENISLEGALEEYLSFRDVGRKPLRPNTVANYRRSIQKNLGAWCKRPIGTISRSEVATKHKSLSKHSPTTADYTMRVLRIVFNYVSETYRYKGQKILVDNPVSQLNSNKAWTEETPRSNVIIPESMPVWFEAVNTLPEWVTGQNANPEVMRDYLLFILFTGLRRREAAHIQKSWFIGDILTIPGDFTKNGESHSLPMTSYLMEIVRLRSIPDSNYLFHGIRKNKPLAEPKRIVGLIREKSGIEFTVHDLRRTFASVAGRIVARDYVVKRLLNHKPAKTDVTAYNYVNLMDDDIREPMKQITDYLLLCSEKRTVKVVSIHS